MVADITVPIERLPVLPNKHVWAEGMYLEPGGAANTVVAARRLNLSTVTLSAVGADDYGAQVLARLAEEGADVSHVIRAGSTVVCIVLADALGQHVFLGIKDSIEQPAYFPEEWHAIIRDARALFTNGYTLRDFPGCDHVFAAMRTAREAGVPIFFDFGPTVETVPRQVSEQVLAMVNVLLLTEEEAGFLCKGGSREQTACSLLELGPSIVVVKLGGEGCLVASEREVVYHPGFPMTVVDTVGAGDSFASGFVAGQLRGGSLRDCAVLANAMGALAVTQRGAGTRLPPRERLIDLLEGEPKVRALA